MKQTTLVIDAEQIREIIGVTSRNEYFRTLSVSSVAIYLARLNYLNVPK